jgi:hypothetical protein
MPRGMPLWFRQTGAIRTCHGKGLDYEKVFKFDCGICYDSRIFPCAWKRVWKNELIEKKNPIWDDLALEWEDEEDRD